MKYTIAAVLSAVWMIAQLASAQATLDSSAGVSEADRPPPAIEHIEPNVGAWWQDAVFYEVFVRSFADSTEGPLAGDGVGDLRGLIERLDYLNDGDPDTTDDLGVDALWLMPVCQSPSYHGYDTTDYRRINDEYGTNEDFKALVAACHERGVKVIIDMVLNHCSQDHPWFVSSTVPGSGAHDWFVWSDEKPDWKGPWGQDVWHASPAGDGSYYYGLFWSGMPDLNYRSESLTEETFDMLRFWLEDLGVDGFRLDAIRHLIEEGKVQENTPATHAWLRRMFDFIKSVNPEAMTVGEVWASSDDVSRYVGDQMDLAFEFDLCYAIVEGLRRGEAWPIAERMKKIRSLYPLGMYATFLRNHDQPRTLHELGGDRAAARLAATIQFCMPGVPFVYYGEEIGMSADKPDEQIRTPMQWSGGAHAGFSTAEPWEEPRDDYAEVNVAAETDDPGSLLSHYREMIALRHEHPALRIGTFTNIETSKPGLLAFVREYEGEKLLCLFNLWIEPIDDFRLGIYEGTPIEDLLGGEVTGSVEMPVDGIAPRGAAIIRLKD